MNYTFLKNLGSGTDGSVFLVEKNKTHYAVKELTRETQEYKILSKLDHPNIIKVYKKYRHDGLDYIVMEYCFSDMWDRISGHTISEEDTIKFSIQIGEALKYIHDQGYTHGDIRLHNILLSWSKCIKLCDFGMSFKGLNDSMYTGELHFCSPEKINGKLYGPESDVWGLGVCIYIMLTNKYPFVHPRNTVKIDYDSKILPKRWRGLFEDIFIKRCSLDHILEDLRERI